MVEGAVSVIGARATAKGTKRLGSQPVLQQSAALCYRFERGQLQVLLISTRRSGRWIIPKGWPIPGLSAAETAAREAWEEAGVSGVLSTEKIGQFTHMKNRSGFGPVMCLVGVYPLRVQHQARQFPEAGERLRRWCMPKEAAQRVCSAELASLLCEFAANSH